MEFHEKLQALRKQRGLTQEELAEKLFVSRTAVSKWESGRGYPKIDSLKGIAAVFGVTIDALLSGDEILDLAEEEQKRNGRQACALVFGLLDLCVLLLLVLPLFAERTDGQVCGVSLMSLVGVQTYLKAGYFALVIGMSIWGVLTLVLRSSTTGAWVRRQKAVSLVGNVMGLLLLVLSLQPYGALFLFTLLAMKVFWLYQAR